MFYEYRIIGNILLFSDYNLISNSSFCANELNLTNDIEILLTSEINQRRNNDEQGGSHAGYYGSTDQQANDYQMMNFTDHQPKFQNFCSLSQRLRTFLHWQYPVSPIVLAEAGLFSTGIHDYPFYLYGRKIHKNHLFIN